MSKTTVLHPSVISQPDASTHTPEVSSGFESVGAIMQRMMINLSRHGDMLYEDVQPRHTTHKPDTHNG